MMLENIDNTQQAKALKGMLDCLSTLSHYFLQLIRLEAQLAWLSLLKIIVLAVISIILLCNLWLGAMLLIFLYLKALGVGNWYAFGYLLAVNVVFLVISLYILFRVIRYTAFPATRRQFLALRNELCGNKILGS